MTKRTSDLLTLAHGPEAAAVLQELEDLFTRCERQGISREAASQILRTERFLRGFERWVAEAPQALVDGPRDVADLLRLM